MKKIAYASLAAAAALALAGCGSSDPASEEAQAENVELPAEEAMTGADAGATPVPEASVAATDAAAAASAAPEASAAAAAEKATTDAEKKM